MGEKSTKVCVTKDDIITKISLPNTAAISIRDPPRIKRNLFQRGKSTTKAPKYRFVHKYKYDHF